MDRNVSPSDLLRELSNLALDGTRSLATSFTQGLSSIGAGIAAATLVPVCALATMGMPASFVKKLASPIWGAQPDIFGLQALAAELSTAAGGTRDLVVGLVGELKDLPGSLLDDEGETEPTSASAESAAGAGSGESEAQEFAAGDENAQPAPRRGDGRDSPSQAAGLGGTGSRPNRIVTDEREADEEDAPVAGAGAPGGSPPIEDDKQEHDESGGDDGSRDRRARTTRDGETTTDRHDRAGGDGPELGVATAAEESLEVTQSVSVLPVEAVDQDEPGPDRRDRTTRDGETTTDRHDRAGDDGPEVSTATAAEASLEVTLSVSALRFEADDQDEPRPDDQPSSRDEQGVRDDEDNEQDEDDSEGVGPDEDDQNASTPIEEGNNQVDEPRSEPGDGPGTRESEGHEDDESEQAPPDDDNDESEDEQSIPGLPEEDSDEPSDDDERDQPSDEPGTREDDDEDRRDDERDDSGDDSRDDDTRHDDDRDDSRDDDTRHDNDRDGSRDDDTRHDNDSRDDDSQDDDRRDNSRDDESGDDD